MNLIVGELSMSERICDKKVSEDPMYSYGKGKSFAAMAKTMTKLTDDGKMLKQVLVTGFASSIPHNTKIVICYKFCSEPFESAYTKVEPFIYCMGVDRTVTGLDIAIQSMTLGEEARFLMTSEYAYGKEGHLNLVSSESSVLYEVEILSGIDLHPLNSFCVFNNSVVKTAIGNRFFLQNRYNLAIRQYHRVISTLENCLVTYADDQTKYLRLEIYLLANLVEVYTKVRQWKLACFNANNVSQLCKEYSLELPHRVYLHKAHSLIELGDYSKAEKLLKKVGRLTSDSKTVEQELAYLYKKQTESRGKPQPSPKHEESSPKRVRKEIEFNSIKAPIEDIIVLESPTPEESNPKRVKKETEFNSIEQLIATKTEPLSTQEESSPKRVTKEIEFNSIEQLIAIKPEPLPTPEESNPERERQDVLFNLLTILKYPIEKLFTMQTEPLPTPEESNPKRVGKEIEFHFLEGPIEELIIVKTEIEDD